MVDTILNNELLQSIFEYSFEGILVVNHQGVIIKANPAIETMFGYKKGELIDKNIETLIPKRIKPAIKKAIKKDRIVILGKRSNVSGFKKDGTPLYLELKLRSTKISTENVIISFVIDASKRMLANNAAILSHSEMEEAQSLAYVGSWSWDLKTNERRWSDEFYRIYGLQPGDKRLNAETAVDFIHPEDRDDAIKAVNKAIANKTPYYYEKRILRPDNTIRDVIAKGKLSYDKKGNPIRMLGTVQDITEIKISKNESILVEARNKAILQAIPDIMFVNNKQGVYLDMHAQNPSVLAMPKDEVIGKNIHDILPKELCKKIVMAFEDSEKTRTPQVFQYSLPIMDVLKHFEARIVAKDNGNFLTIIRDITSQKEAEEILKKNEENLSYFIKHMPVAVAMLNKEGKYVAVSEKWLNDFEYSVKDIVGLEHVKTFPDFQERWKENIPRGLAGETLVMEEDHIIRKDGTTNWIKWVVQPWYNFVGEIGGVIIFTEDINEHILIKKALKDNEDRLRDYAVGLEEKVQERTKELKATVQKLVESNLNLEDQIQVTKEAKSRAIANQAIFSVIAKNFPKGIIIVANANFEIEYIEGEELEKMGLKDFALPGTYIDEIEIFSKSRKTRLKQDIRKTLTGKHLSFEIEFKNSIYSVNSTPLYDDNKKVIQALLVYSNISEQKQVQLEILNALNKERELNELKSRFISMASHEFRTPLSAILSSATLIEKLNEPGKEVKRLKYTDKIKSNVRNLVVILNDFLSLSKLEEGKMSIQPEYFDLIDFLKSLIEEIETNKKEGQTITIINDHPSIEVKLDPKLISHILLNLISNAIKYSPKNKEITLRITRKNERIFIEVADHGIGIPIEEQNHLFDRFFRAENTRNIQGTGLGLHIAKQYTELIGGNISFKSKLSKGSTFTVELPINQRKNEKSIID